MRFFLTCLLVIFILGTAQAKAATDYPNKPIKVIVPFSAGGGTDSIMRILAKYMEPVLGQKIGIVNMEGASGSTGAMQVFQAQPDGYTLLFHHTSLLTSYHTGIGRFTWDELTPICNVADFDLVIVVNEDAPWKNIEDLVEDAKKRPGQIKFGVNMGAGAHFATIGLELASGAKFHHVAAGGDAKRTTALLGKHVDVTHPAGSAIVQYVQAGKLRALATFGTKRTPGIDTPTLIESGYATKTPFYNGLFGPAKLPQEVVDKLNKAVVEAMKQPEFLDTLKNATLYPDYMDEKTFKRALLELDAELYKEARSEGLIPSQMKR